MNRGQNDERTTSKKRQLRLKGDAMVSRRDFTRLLTLGGSAALLAESRLAWPAPLQSTPERPDERYWGSVRDQFLMPRELAVLNAANLCPSPAPVLEAVYRNTKDMDN